MRDNGAETLFSWACTTYEIPGVAALLLRLQDEFGADICMLLWCLWHAENRRRLDGAAINNAEERISSWRRTVVQPLRTIRQQAKGAVLISPEAYAAIKKAELSSERVQLDALEQVAHDDISNLPQSAVRDIALQNLKSYRHCLSGRDGVHCAPDDLLDTLSALVFSGSQTTGLRKGAPRHA